MNERLDKKLAELTEEARKEGSASVYAVLSLLRGCYRHGKQKEFAKHCCEFSNAALTPPVARLEKGARETTVH